MVRIGVVISVYKHWQYVDNAISSVLSQDYKHFTLYLINDDPDKRDYVPPDDKRVVYICDGQNLGQTKRYNQALELCTEDVFCCLGADDSYCPSIFGTIAVLFNPVRNISCVYGAYFLKGKVVRPGPFDRKKLEKKNYIAAGATFYRTKLIKNTGFNERLRVGEDYELLLLVTNVTKPWYLDIAVFFHHPERSITRSYIRKKSKINSLKRRIFMYFNRRKFRCLLY